MLNCRVGFQTDIGRKRTQNQDFGEVHADIGLFIVADGMGGHKGGETASRMATQIISETVRSRINQKDFDPKNVLVSAIREASKSVFEHAMKNTELQGMGTTAVSILFHQGMAYVGHVGDSRCYFLLPGEIWQVTRDHSLVQEKLRAGLISRDQVRNDRMKNVITRSVGFEAKVEVDVYEMKAIEGSVFLLCSDGLTGQLEDPEIRQVVDREIFEKGNPDAAAKILVEAANQSGGDDNITVTVVYLEDEKTEL